jgi:fibronectin-binding autotransporter adhesin
MAGFRSGSGGVVRGVGIGALVSAMVAVLVAVASPAQAGTINVNCPAMNLQNKIDAAPGGSTLLITGTCVGNFTVDKTLTLKGNPSATLDGNQAGTTLSITDHTVHLVALTIIHGSAVAGAGIHREGGGGLSLKRVIVRDNVAAGPFFAEGGGIDAGSAPLTLTASRVVHNLALATGDSSAEALGGGIVSHRLTLTGSTVSFNRAVAKATNGDAFAEGGGVFGVGTFSASSSHLDGNHASAIGASAAASGGAVRSGQSGVEDITIQNSTASGNVALAQSGPGLAEAKAGAVWARFADGIISGSTIENNHATARSDGGQATAVGGAIDAIGNTLTLTATRVIGDNPTAKNPNLHAVGKTSATVKGGGLFSDTDHLRIRSSSISTSSIVAESIDGQPTAFGGGIDLDGALVMSRSTVNRNFVFTGTATANTFGFAGAIRVSSASSILASTLSRNRVQVGGHGLAGSGGGALTLNGPGPHRITNSTIAANDASATVNTGTAVALGGAVQASADSVLLTNTTVAGNKVSGSADTEEFLGGGIYVALGTTTLKGTIVAQNLAPLSGGPNCSGTVHSQGRNLLGKTAGCDFLTKPTDLLHKDPLLGFLGDHGGPTQTLPLLAASPAMDVIPPVACAVATDQRGVHRPQGPGCDIGSFERKV